MITLGEYLDDANANGYNNVSEYAAERLAVKRALKLRGVRYDSEAPLMELKRLCEEVVS